MNVVPQSTKSKILVIDDSAMMRTYLSKILSGAYDVEVSDRLLPEEVESRILESDPDLVITDYQMPGCNGGVVARLAIKAKPGLPVLVVTAMRDNEITQMLKVLQVFQIIYKPITPDLLLAAVDMAINNFSHWKPQSESVKIVSGGIPLRVIKTTDS